MNRKHLEVYCEQICTNAVDTLSGEDEVDAKALEHLREAIKNAFYDWALGNIDIIQALKEGWPR